MFPFRYHLYSWREQDFSWQLGQFWKAGEIWERCLVLYLKVIFNAACPSLYSAHDRRRDAFPPAVSERSHGSVRKLFLLLFPFHIKWRMTIFLCKTQTLSDTKVSFPSQEMTSPRRAARRRALTSITFTLLTISRLCLSCHTGWNLVLKGHNSPRSVSHRRSFQSTSTSQDMVSEDAPGHNTVRGKWGQMLNCLTAPQQPRIVLTVSQLLLEREQRIPAAASRWEGSTCLYSLFMLRKKSKGSTESSQWRCNQPVQWGSNNASGWHAVFPVGQSTGGEERRPRLKSGFIPSWLALHFLDSWQDEAASAAHWGFPGSRPTVRLDAGVSVAPGWWRHWCNPESNWALLGHRIFLHPPPAHHTTPPTECPGAELISWSRSGQRRPRRPSVASSKACPDAAGHTGNYTQLITSCPEDIYRSWIM